MELRDWLNSTVNHAKKNFISESSKILDQIDQTLVDKLDKKSELYSLLHKDEFRELVPRKAESQLKKILDIELDAGMLTRISANTQYRPFFAGCSNISKGKGQYRKTVASDLVAQAKSLLKSMNDGEGIMKKRKLADVDGELNNFNAILGWVNDKIPSNWKTIRHYVLLTLWLVMLSLEDVSENESNPQDKRAEAQNLCLIVAAINVSLPKAG